MWPLVAMMALSAAKSYSDNQKATADNKMNGEIMRYSPWTHMQPGGIKHGDTFGNMSQGLAAGLAMNQGLGGDPNSTTTAASQPVYEDAGTTSLNGNGPLTGAQNSAAAAAPRVAGDYSSAGAGGYGAYPGAGTGDAYAAARPSYVAPGEYPEMPRKRGSWMNIASN